jgi:hypothetical protein
MKNKLRIQINLIEMLFYFLNFFDRTGTFYLDYYCIRIIKLGSYY